MAVTTLPPEVTRDDLIVIKEMIENRDYQTAGSALTNYLSDSPDDLDAWFLMGNLLLQQDNPALSRMIYRWLVDNGGGDKWQNWMNLGKSEDNLNLPEEAQISYRKSLELDPQNAHILTAIGTNYVQQHKSDLAIDYCRQALEIDPDRQMARSSMGFAYLQKRDWANGWDFYEAGYGKLRWRQERLYGHDEPRWDGTKHKSCHVIVHGEQGVGDQIAGLEPLRDMANATTIVAVEVDAKVRGLVARSYPDIEVYGTLKEKNLTWPLTKQKVDAHAGFFSLHRHFRRQESDYQGQPYLVPDPQRRIQWRALLDSLGPEPKIGIAWTGGVSLTQRSTRRADLFQLLPILRKHCHWISLEYRDRSHEIQKLLRQRHVVIHDWPLATRTDDYDDTAALVAELDLVICVPTSVMHLAGALGVPTFCLVHPRPGIECGSSGDHLAFYGKTVRLFRREKDDDWSDQVNTVKEELGKFISTNKPQRPVEINRTTRSCRVFIGYDERQSVAYNVLQQSILKRSRRQVSISPVVLSTLPMSRHGLTPFTYSRFLVPWICGYQGWALFLDADMLVLGNIAEVFALADEKYAVMVVKNSEQFEWASLMLFNCAHPANRILTPGYIDDPRKSISPHYMDWLDQELVGELPSEWNHTVGYDAPRNDAKLVHFTQGVPAHPEIEGCEYTDEWFKEYRLLKETSSWQELMGNSVHAKKDANGEMIPRLKAS